VATTLARYLAIAFDLASLTLITGESDGVRLFQSKGTSVSVLELSAYHAMEIYRFRFARVCVPLFDSAFLLASPLGTATELSVVARGEDPLA
jgi:hypothetical protein